MVGIGTLHRGVTDECILFARWLAAGFTGSLRPESAPTLYTSVTSEIIILEKKEIELRHTGSVMMQFI
jgi:hypothetical protein